MAKKKTTKPQDQVFQLKITLDETNPVVWRRVLVPGIFTLDKLHSVFQYAMGWQMSHLYDFQIKGERYSEPDEYDDKARSVGASLVSRVGPKDQFIYNYDFGDSWSHTVEVEEVLGREEKYTYPVCIGGENACPPEDCGGTGGYEDLKRVILDPTDDEHESMMTWLSGFFDPHSFDLNRINRDFLWQVDWDAEPNDQGLYLPAIYSEDSSQEEMLDA